jgi:hypothetical protein
MMSLPLVQPEEGQYGHDHDDQPDEIDKRIHCTVSSVPEQGKQDDDGKWNTQKPKEKSSAKAHDVALH